MVYGLIHLVVAVALAKSVQGSLARGYILDEDDEQVTAGSVSFMISMFVQTGLAVYCVVMGVRALACI